MFDYDKVIDRAEKLMSLFLANGRPVQEPPGVLLAELSPVPYENHRNRVALPFLTKWLVLRSHSKRYADPDEMLHWALMARLTAESCTAATAGSQARLADLQALAWGQLGNALRVFGRLVESRDAMDLAERHRKSGTGDSELRARLLEQTASLRMAQRDFASAAEMLDEALDIHENLREASALASGLILRAAAAHHEGQPDRSIQLLNRAISLLDPLMDPELVLVAQRNQAESYLKVGQAQMALILHSAARHLQGGAPRALLVRMDWQEGNLLSEMGSFNLAEATLLRVRQEFSAMKLATDIAYVSVDLATLYGRMGNEPRREQVLLEGRRLALELRAEPETLTSFQELFTPR
ncbi:MAG: hypothetical protein QOJ16_4248 [Acidobacteriota bacterium]|jgi:tetratricopeptide (TPR) repeat protein|nr:hypothetical protein [Acidobacteriota bacterium]